MGGNPTLDGYYTKYNSFIRSDAPLSYSNENIQTLIDYGIRTIIDLRNTKIVELSPNCFIENTEFDCFNYAIAEGIPSPKTELEFIQMYFQITRNKQIMSSLFKTIANSSGGVFFHCQEGKDRTGVLSAILLSLAGVFKDDIYADYQVSSTYFREHARVALEAFKDMPIFLIETKVDYIEGFLNLFYDEYNSAQGYLRFLGLSDMEIEQIYAKLICNGRNN